jgi:23S rRNA pseudouridine2605 synthase
VNQVSRAERLQKIISAAGIASRRHAEVLILAGKVSVNGKIVTELGTKADPETDHIKVDGKLIREFPEKVYILLNKPRQVMSTTSDPQGRTKVTDLVPSKIKLNPVGRLDYGTEGIILLTNDGAFLKCASAAGESLPKVYHVKVRSSPDDRTLARLRSGLVLKSGAHLGKCKIEPLRQANNTWLEVTLYQGINRQIREMFQQVGHPVMKLRRVKIGFLTDRGLAPGQFRPLTAQEVERVFRLTAAGRKKPQSQPKEA